ncbi:hypothetical protein FPZ12_043770 [Amycolatopsis acidicola]|uniref:DUF2867 domain-containing protein n=1 Tax=Amycolatopsis acidicola TaxID=2596893 RepID=A0A5N0UJA0_9PSEU|nr:hypothetical protein [Amycolatopsis acidicola]KAA9149193.1 hypothetical protein FPZ12_043770 [Amycolatopsis acidicola]
MRRMPVTEGLRAACTLPRIDRGTAFAATIPEFPGKSPEEWARAVFEGAPAPVRVFLRAAWRCGLGVHLGPFPSAEFVLGNEIVRTGDGSVTLEMRGPLLAAQNVVAVAGSTLEWATFLDFRGVAGRVLWSLAEPVHHRLLPALARRAAS